MTVSIKRVRFTECPNCRTPIQCRRQLQIGQIVICPDCYAELEVQQLKPLQLSWTFYDCAHKYVGIDD